MRRGDVVAAACIFLGGAACAKAGPLAFAGAVTAMIGFGLLVRTVKP